jgi:hypothetical protein
MEAILDKMCISYTFVSFCQILVAIVDILFLLKYFLFIRKGNLNNRRNVETDRHLILDSG